MRHILIASTLLLLYTASQQCYLITPQEWYVTSVKNLSINDKCYIAAWLYYGIKAGGVYDVHLGAHQSHCYTELVTDIMTAYDDAGHDAQHVIDWMPIGTPAVSCYANWTKILRERYAALYSDLDGSCIPFGSDVGLLWPRF